MSVAVALLLVEMSALASAGSAATFSQGRAQYELNHVAEAERIYRAVVADPSASVTDRAAAERELARIAWLIDRNATRALAHLDAARAIGAKPCDTAEMTARVLRESRRDAEAIRREDELLADCPDEAERNGVRTHLLGARLDFAATEARQRPELLRQAAAEAAQFTVDADVEAARVRLETALLTGDAPAALAAWKDYFWLGDSDAPQALQGFGVSAIFNNGLRGDASVDDRLKLAELLMRAGFSDQSQRFANLHRLGAAAGSTPTWRRLNAYWTARKKFEARLLQEYRHFARRGNGEAVLKAEAADLKQAAAKWTSMLLSAAGGHGAPKDVLLRVYGLVGTDGGTTNGYPSIHLGHVIEDHDDQVTQYGHTAKIHFMAIDNMISNSFTSWLWDGSAMVGGWTANGVIVHVRPAYVQSPLRAYRQTQDSEARRTLIERANQFGPEDLAKLRQRPVATLDGLSNRLQLQVVDRVAAVARVKSTDEAGFRRAFLAEYSRANLDQSIRKHEGRHAIDETLGISGKVDQSVLEYRAKLSELALTDYPRMALRNLDRTLEGDGPHDKAGARIFDGYRQWMEAHPDQIMGFDRSAPALIQLDKLSDDQIREIARSLDPFAKGP